jgi:hypothetical protein
LREAAAALLLLLLLEGRVAALVVLPVAAGCVWQACGVVGPARRHDRTILLLLLLLQEA